MYNTGVSGSTGGQRTGSDALGLEMKTAASHLVVAVWKLNLRSLQKQRMLSHLFSPKQMHPKNHIKKELH